MTCAAALLWRGSGLLRFWTFFLACTAFALPTYHAGRAWVSRSSLVDVLGALFGAGLHTGLGAARLALRRTEAPPSHSPETARTASVLRTVLVGALVGAVPLLVFGALFVSADAVFARMLGNLVRFDFEMLLGHVLGIAGLTWLASGYLTGMLAGTRIDRPNDLRLSVPRLGTAEVATAMGLVDLLFLSFVAIQLRYLFGGSAMVQVTPDLTYAAYAREGFFQLVATVGLALPWLLVTHRLLEDGGVRARSLFAGLAGLQLVLLFVVVASAFQRMLAYQDAYGLTELRVVATAGLVALTGLVIWFGVTVLTGRAHRFALGGLVAAYLLVGSLHLINPGALVARHNLDRGAGLVELDVAHLASLGSDAAPILVNRMVELAPNDRCTVAKALLRSWGPDRPGDWRSFNLSEARARATVVSAMSMLEQAAANSCD